MAGKRCMRRSNAARRAGSAQRRRAAAAARGLLISAISIADISPGRRPLCAGACDFARGRKAAQADDAALVDQHMVQLQVEVGDVAVHARTPSRSTDRRPADDLGGLSIRVLGRSIRSSVTPGCARRDEAASGPARRSRRTGERFGVESRGKADRGVPVRKRRGVDRLAPRQASA